MRTMKGVTKSFDCNFADICCRYAYSVQIGADGVPLDNMNDIGIATDSSDEGSGGELKVRKNSAKNVPEDDVDLANDSTDKSDEDHSWDK